MNTNKMLRVYLFKSRNKDNKDVDGFKERVKSFVAYDGDNSIDDLFKDFVKGGLIGEKCRLYKSVNARDEEKIKKHLVAHLLLSENPTSVTHMESTVASIASRKECALEGKWLFDFDLKDKDVLKQFIEDINKSPKAGGLNPDITETVNGYAVVVEHGFDTRGLLEKYKDVVDLKRDDLLFIKIEENTVE